MEIFKLLMVIMGVLMSLAYYPQAYLIWKSKSSVNISIPAYIIFSLGTLMWTVYGVLIQNNIIVTSFVIGVVGSWMVLILALIYRKR